MAAGGGTGGGGMKAARLKLDGFDIGVTIGTGSMARVMLATHKPTDTVWCLKRVAKVDAVRLQMIDHVLGEKEAMECLGSHPFICKLAATFQDKRYLFFVLEYVPGGELFTHIRKEERFSHEAARFYAAQVVLALDHMHEQQWIYRDLKPENLLVDRLGFLRVVDFGLSKRAPFKTYTLCGTPEYLAPEILLNRGHGKGVDWWALGILLFEMLTGDPPFKGATPMATYAQIIAGRIVFPKFLERTAKSLIKRLLVFDLSRRFGCLRRGADDVKQHKFFAGHVDWDGLAARTVDPPMVPEVGGRMDASNFDPYGLVDEEVPEPEYEDGDPFEDF